MPHSFESACGRCAGGSTGGRARQGAGRQAGRRRAARRAAGMGGGRGRPARARVAAGPGRRNSGGPPATRVSSQPQAAHEYVAPVGRHGGCTAHRAPQASPLERGHPAQDTSMQYSPVHPPAHRSTRRAHTPPRCGWARTPVGRVGRRKGWKAAAQSSAMPAAQRAGSSPAQAASRRGGRGREGGRAAARAGGRQAGGRAGPGAGAPAWSWAGCHGRPAAC